uniref:Uncharacterized protein n=2 Tax=Kalanchoe fedtschenkoi TaxID=63787 RepID=A0A7N0VB10_KALFE
MRDFVSCFSEYAVSVADTSCSSYGSSACIAPSLVPSVLNAVTSLYKITLSNQKQLMITVAWCKTQMSQGLSISFSDTRLSSFKLNVNSRLFRKTKGSKTFESDNWKVEVFWDLSAARYQSGPEPVDGYYILVTVDSELGLVLGDLAAEAADKKMKSGYHAAKASLVTRKEHCSGSTLYTTKAKFCEAGSQHDILIRCSGEGEGLKYPVLSVSIDKKTVARVKRLQWNFRGNQSIFVDGLLIDLMWDVHDWFFNPSSGYAVFMFRTRNGFDNRLWLEEKMLQREQADKVDFSLLIHASKSS